MWILGLTGAIGAGKSTVADQFRGMGVPVHCADQEIHTLMETDQEIQERVRQLWPFSFVEGKINRKILGDYVLENPRELKALEAILYPKLAARQKRFLDKQSALKAPAIVLDVPLLLEVGLDRSCHRVLLVEAPSLIRKWRVLRRSGMSLKKLKKFEFHQYTAKTRRKKADFIIPTGRGKRISLEKIKAILQVLSQAHPPPWKGKWPTTLEREPYGKRNRSGYGDNRL